MLKALFSQVKKATMVSASILNGALTLSLLVAIFVVC